MPADADARVLVGRYIPNLVPRLFTLDRDFIQEIRDLVPAEPLDEILADYDTWITERPGKSAVVVIELLAWQFASPALDRDPGPAVHREEAAGGVGVERLSRSVCGRRPTVAGLAANAL